MYPLVNTSFLYTFLKNASVFTALIKLITGHYKPFIAATKNDFIFFLVSIFRHVHLPAALLQPLDVIFQDFIIYEYLLLLKFNPVQVKIAVSYLIQSVLPASA